MTVFKEYYLVESTNYLAMFNDFINADPAARDESKKTIDKYITWAKQTLKKNDRIVWFLRFVRIELAGKIKHKNSAEELARLNKKLGTSYTMGDMIPINNLMTNLQHYTTVPSPELQKIVFDKQSPSELMQQMSEIEEEWKGSANDDADAKEMDKAGRLLRPDDAHEIVMSFPDGFVWFDLKKRGCPEEANAMGHCGNGSGRHGETVLSLRKPIKMGDRMKWYPVCTFILDQHGMLGEMKGRNNDKPVARYHKYIVPLLMSERIKGIKGGGYMPENNFKLSDLPEEEAEELLEQKPELGDVEMLYDKEGMTERVQEMVFMGLNEKNYPTGGVKYIAAEKKFVVCKFGKFEYFLRYIGDDECEKILEIATSNDFDIDMKQMFRSTVMELSSEWQQKFMETTNTGTIEQAIEHMVRYYDDWYAKFEDVVMSAMNFKDEAWARLEEYSEVGWRFDSYYVYTNLPRDHIRKFVESGEIVYAYVSEQDMVYYAAPVGDNDDGDYYLHGSYGEYSWTSDENGYLNERRREEGLLDRDGKDTIFKGKASNYTEFDITEDYIKALTTGRISRKIKDPRQIELDVGDLTESVVARILKLSGL
jgi:hypothetical protein